MEQILSQVLPTVLNATNVTNKGSNTFHICITIRLKNKKR